MNATDNLPAWLDKLRAANGTEDCPNADPSVNYFNYAPAATKNGKRRRFSAPEPKRYLIDEFEFNPFDDDDEDETDSLNRWFFEQNKKRESENDDEMPALKKAVFSASGESSVVMIRCNLDGKPILRSLSELERRGDKVLSNILATKTGAIWAIDSDGVGKTFERKDTVFVDYAGYVELYFVAVAVGSEAETVFRVTVNTNFGSTLIIVTDDALKKRVIDIYKNRA